MSGSIGYSVIGGGAIGANQAIAGGGVPPDGPEAFVGDAQGFRSTAFGAPSVLAIMPAIGRAPATVIPAAALVTIMPAHGAAPSTVFPDAALVTAWRAHGFTETVFGTPRVSTSLAHHADAPATRFGGAGLIEVYAAGPLGPTTRFGTLSARIDLIAEAQGFSSTVFGNPSFGAMQVRAIPVAPALRFGRHLLDRSVRC